MPQFNDIIIPLLVMLNFTALVVMAFDKAHAKKNKRRVPERVLFFIALIGGSVGIFAGMYVLRHKTRKPRFFIGIPLIILGQAALIYFLFFS